MIEIEFHWLALTLLTGVLASVHLWFPRFDIRFAAHTARWIGFVGGIATGYVVLYMLPKIARATVAIIGLDETVEVEFLDLQLYLLMLSAMVIYLSMLHLGRLGQHRQRLANLFNYSVHGAYSFLLGYVFVEISAEYMTVNLVVALILALHLLGMNHILRTNHQRGYDDSARWIFCALLLLGGGLGLITELPKVFINGLTAFLAGIILINVISEELPLTQQQRVPWYMLGIGVYLLASLFILSVNPPTAY